MKEFLFNYRFGGAQSADGEDEVFDGAGLKGWRESEKDNAPTPLSLQKGPGYARQGQHSEGVFILNIPCARRISDVGYVAKPGREHGPAGRGSCSSSLFRQAPLTTLH